MSNDKKTLRKLCLSRRDSLTPEQRKDFSEKIIEKLLPYLKDKVIFSYYPIGSEVDLSSLEKRFPIAYPVIFPNRKMEAYLPKGPLIPNRYGIPEPDPNTSIKIEKEDIGVILVPCVGFSKRKDRLGYGGGYYDRYLKETKALKIGIAFEVQKLDFLPIEENDIPLDLFITEKDVY